MAFLSPRETLPKHSKSTFFYAGGFFAFLDQIGGKVSYILLCKSHRPLEQPRDCLVRQIWSPMTFLSLRETLPKTLQIDCFPCRRSFEWKTRSFQYFSFLFCKYFKTEQELSSNAKNKWCCLPQKKVSLLPCVCFSLLRSFSQL